MYMASPGASTPLGVARPSGTVGSSSDEDVEDVVPSGRKRLLATFDRFTITDDGRRVERVERVERVGRASEGVDLGPPPEVCRDGQRSEAGEYNVNESKIKEEASTSHLVLPSTKKRKGVRKATSSKALKSLSDLSKRFGDIQLNKDFYDSIKQTESRCEPGEDVRDVDRQAFSDALVEVEQLIREQHEAMLRDSGDGPESREMGAISLVALSLDVIQYFVDIGTTTSSTATTGVTLEHSLSKSTSQNVNTSEVIESPWKAKKHPRRSQSIQEGDGEESIGRRPSRQLSLISNDHPKRQRKYEMDEVSSKPLADAEDFGEIGVVDVNSADAEKNIQDECREEVTAPGAPSDEVGDEDRSQSHTHASSKMQSAAELDKRKVQVAEGEEGGVGGGRDEKSIWKSSLVCADVSLNEVGSRIYAPLIISLRAAGLVGANMGGDGGQNEHDEDSEAFDSLIKSHAVTSKESTELGNTIYSAVENVYVDTYGLRNAKVAQKALALVLEAFDCIVKDVLAADGGDTEGDSDEDESEDQGDAGCDQGEERGESDGGSDTDSDQRGVIMHGSTCFAEIDQ